MRDVAIEAGVSHGTVSHALNHPERVSVANREKVREAMDRLGFVRNEAARHLRSGSSTTLGLVLIDNWNPFFNEVTRGFEDAVTESGWTVIVANSALSEAREARHLDSFEERRLGGVLIIPQGEQTFPRLLRMRSRGMSAVLVDQHAGTADIPSVSVDDLHGGTLAGSHLRSLGRRRIAFVGNPEVLSHASRRLEGLEAGAGCDAVIETVAVRHLDFDSGAEAGERLARRPAEKRPDGVFCANDMLALGVLQALAHHRIDVPGEIAVIGYDDLGFATRIATPLTSIRQPAYELGARAGSLLLEDIASGRSGSAEHVVYTPELVPRASTVG